MEPFRSPEIRLETIRRTVLVTDARNSSKAYFSEKAEEALVRIERDRALFHTLAEAHGGEEVRDRGDGSMFAFCDPVEAIRAAMAMQTEIARTNLELKPGELRLEHRMGVQMGEVKVVLTEDSHGVVHRKISGDMVVTAARLEGIAHPGEVCFSNDVYKAIRGTIAHDFRCLDSTLKGFDRPVRVWSTRIDREWERPLTAEEEAGKARRREEVRLREKWEREGRDRSRRRAWVRFAGVAAIASLGFAGVRYTEIDKVLTARLAPRSTPVAGSAPEDAGTEVIVPQEDRMTVDTGVNRTERRRKGIKAKRAVLRPAPKRPDPRLVVAGIVSERLGEGDFDGIATALEERRLNGRFPDVYGAASNLQNVKRWLVERFTDGANGGETVAVALLVPIHGMARLTGVEEGRLVGTDATGEETSVEYGLLTPEDLGRVVQAAIPPEGFSQPPFPAERCVQDLEVLRGAMR